MQNKTTVVKAKDIKREWHHFNADGVILGKLAEDIARLLIGKDKVLQAPNANVGDIVVVTNAEKIAVTGKKMTDKKYYWHTGFPKGLREITLGKLIIKKPEEVIYNAVKGMLPKNRLQKERLANLHVYAGENHPHQAQISSKK